MHVYLGFVALIGNLINQLAYDDDDASRCHHTAYSNIKLNDIKNIDCVVFLSFNNMFE